MFDKKNIGMFLSYSTPFTNIYYYGPNIQKKYHIFNKITK
jgi:hypothetical protein